MARIEERGLQYTYGELIREAFQPSLWESGELVEGEFTQAESNFSLFWGLALQADQTTLISNGSPFDRFQEGSAGALTAQEQEGMRLFQTTGRCSTCHSGAEFSAATYSNNGGRGNNRAFHRTGVRDAVEDAGAGNGSFKSIGLRNVELTGPYFHNGGQATLEQVIEFYARGGDFGNNAIRPFNMSSTQKASLAAFLRALTDERVRFERAPFDHPELCVPAEHVELRPGVLIAALAWQYPRSSLENWAGLAAVGGGGTRDAVADFRGDAGGHRGRWVTGQCDERGVCGALAMMGGCGIGVYLRTFPRINVSIGVRFGTPDHLYGALSKRLWGGAGGLGDLTGAGRGANGLICHAAGRRDAGRLVSICLPLESGGFWLTRAIGIGDGTKFPVLGGEALLISLILLGRG